MSGRIDTFRNELNGLYAARVPFLFLIDFEMQRPAIRRLDTIDPTELLYDFNGNTNAPALAPGSNEVVLKRYPVSISEYETRFNRVMEALLYGDSFLVNLTVKTEVEAPVGLRELFHYCRARYKIWLKNSFLVFSPESFVRISDDRVYSYPMKGTIDASLPDAELRILTDKKELAEHVTIVDLIRNDLSMIASHVHVGRFRYIDRIESKGKTLLQVSSEVSGRLLPGFASDPAGCLLALLPAGSISGAPKAKTLQIIRDAEGEDRGYYTGICGIFDGNSIDTGVMIRYLEQQNSKLYYRSGGGITTQSQLQSEYQEVLDKIYVPTH